MRRNRDPAAHVRHDQPHLLIAPPQPARMAPGHGLGVQRVADERPLHQRRAGEPRARLPLIHRHRVHDVRLHARRPRKSQSQHRAQIGRMFSAPRAPQLLHHRLVHQIGAALHRRQQASASGHCGPGLRAPPALAISRFFERGLDPPRAVLQPVQHGPPAEPPDLFVAVMNVARHLLARARKDAELRRRRSGVQDKDPLVLAAQASPLWRH